MTWPLSGHVALALATGLACGIAASRYPDVIAAPYAATLGTLILYPVMVAAWWRFHSPGGRQR
jgi:energy-converting hydrogenase Eha subunit C